MIYILEGPDGVGKSTLAERIARSVKGMVIHAYFDKSWPMKEYHDELMKTAKRLDKMGVPVIMDRWASSEEVYGKVFRDGPQFDTERLISKHDDGSLVWIYCTHENAVSNHKKHVEKRHEMFDDMTDVVTTFDEYVKARPEYEWYAYDYDKVDASQFIEDLPR